MTRGEAKDFMWIENDKNPTIIRWQHHSTISGLVSNLIDKIFDEHEAQLKAKDKRIVELEEAINPKTCEGCKYYSPYRQQECLHEKYCQREFTDYYEPKDNA